VVTSSNESVTPLSLLHIFQLRPNKKQHAMRLSLLGLLPIFFTAAMAAETNAMIPAGECDYGLDTCKEGILLLISPLLGHI
jgi:hypothetical protein